MNILSVLLEKSTGQKLKNKVPYPLPPNSDGSYNLMPGLDPDLEWFFVYKPFEEPEYDPRIFFLQTVEEFTNEPHPNHPNFKQYRITYKAIKRPAEDIKRALQDAEAEANESILPISEQVKTLTLAVNTIHRLVKATNLQPKEAEVLSKVNSVAAKIWKNDEIVKQKHAQVDNDIEPDIDGAGWERNQ